MSMPITFLLLLLPAVLLMSQNAHCTTVLVDGVAEWKNPTVHVGDTVIFRHKFGYEVYIFRDQRAFALCNFTLATLLTKPNASSYTWHPSRPGFFYFAFNNGSSSATCRGSQKMPVEVLTSSKQPPPADDPIMLPEFPPMSAPAPVPGGVVSSSPAFPWPFRPREEISPGPSPGADAPAGLLPEKGGGIPFINSNPAVPLPTGEVDSATIKPLPTSSGQGTHAQGVAEMIQLQIALMWGMFLML